MKHFYILLITLLLSSKLFASHIVGGDIYYEYLGNNVYKIYVTLYRDCFSTGAAYDNPMPVSIYNAKNQLIYNLQISFPGSTQVPIVFNNPCVIKPTDVCVEKATYTQTVTLPPIIGGYTISYQRCCRGSRVTNLLWPDQTGLTLTTHIPGSETGFSANSSPSFSSYPPIVICSKETLNFSHLASDLDGDSIAYSLVTPFEGASSATPAPTIIPAPSYSYVTWKSGYSTNNPLGSGATIAINPTTGILTVKPSNIGFYVVGICAKEYRNGILVSQTVRDFLFDVIDCDKSVIADIPTQTKMSYFTSYCQGLSVKFDNLSKGASSYSWDFGDLTTQNDVSTAVTPSYTYPTPGTYLVTLVANPGTTCSDTIQETLILDTKFDVSFTSDDSLCFKNNAYNFYGTIIGQNNANSSVVWDFGANASIQQTTSLNVSNVHFNKSGIIPITLKGTHALCTSTFTKNIYVVEPAKADFNLPANYLCNGLNLALVNKSTNATKYHWDFGVPGITSDTSILFSPQYSYLPGTYTIQLIAGKIPKCYDTINQTVTMNEKLKVDFNVNHDSICITNNSFDFNGSFVGSPTTQFLWNFGNSTSPINDQTLLQQNGIQFTSGGAHSVKLVGTYQTCKDSITKSIFLYNEPTINFNIGTGLMCVPFPANFIDLSTSDTPLNYRWDFGDGSTSNAYNPQHVYTNIGTYTVQYKIFANKGCTDTLTLSKPNLITVHETPKAGFTVDTTEVDICNSSISFTDLSQGASNYTYIFGDGGISNEINPDYSYRKDGQYYPTQYVTNQWGCLDSSFVQVFVNPYTIYIPNSFTPDGNNLNSQFKPYVYIPSNYWRFRIYNRWGELIFETTDQTKGWDGTYLNAPCQVGEYVYELLYESCNIYEGRRALRGNVNLLR